MDREEPRRPDLTEEQWAQRVAWAREMWLTPADSDRWQAVADCMYAVCQQKHEWARVLPSELFRTPYLHRELLNAVLEEYATRKLLGEAS